MKQVAITGASSGIGKALALEYARRGADLLLLARRTDKLAEVAAQIGTIAPKCHVVCQALDVAELDRIYPALVTGAEQLGGLDCVIANAGITGVHKTGVGDFDINIRVIQTNLLGGMATVDAAARWFREQQQTGTIVGISSVSAFKGIPGSAAYSASKAGFSNYLDATRMELAKHGITVCAVHPGFINTDIAPNMEKYPFVIEADKAAQRIATGIAAGEASVIVPAMPWKVLARAMPLLPDAVMKRMF